MTPSASSDLGLQDQRTKTVHQISNYDKGHQQRYNSVPTVRVSLSSIFASGTLWCVASEVRWMPQYYASNYLNQRL